MTLMVHERTIDADKEVLLPRGSNMWRPEAAASSRFRRLALSPKPPEPYLGPH